MTHLTAEEQAKVSSLLRPKEEVLWAGKPITASPNAAPVTLMSKFRSIFRAHKASVDTGSELYIITSKRVMILPKAEQVQEWFLMLGMIQATEERADGSGDIILDYDIDLSSGERTARGLLNLPNISMVLPILRSAIDAAYNASPWSV